MGPLAHLLLALAVQAPTAQVSGVVREAGSDRPLGGAVVAVSDAGLVRETDPQGRYRLTGVPPGPMQCRHARCRRWRGSNRGSACTAPMVTPRSS